MLTATVRALDLDDIITQIADGATLTQICQRYKVDKRILHRELFKHPDYHDAKECALESKLDEVQEDIASPDCDIARVREKLKLATWRAEREAPQRWGAKATVSTDLSISVTIRSSGSNGRVIEAESVQIDAQTLLPKADDAPQ